jgi:tripartite-type tricarboxylate transporter receptor subunit TctC
MTLQRRRFLKLAAAAVALPSVAHAQGYPSRPISLIVAYAAGGPTDTIGRTVAEAMRADLGQTIVPENVGGAAGSTGMARLARAPNDGLTIAVSNWSAMVVNGAIYSLPYDLRSDFEPIALLAQAPQLVVAKKAFPAKDLKEFIAWLKGNPDKTTTGPRAPVALRTSPPCCSSR